MGKEKNLEEKVERNTKHIWWLTIIMVVLLVAAALGGYLAGASRIANEVVEQKNDVEEKVSEEPVEFSMDTLKQYVESVNPGTAKLYDVDKIVASDLSAREKIEFIPKLLINKKTSSADYAYDIIAESDVKEAVEKVYGPNTYEKTKFNLGCGDYELNESDGKYYSKTGCGGTSTFFIRNNVTDYKATKSKLEITTNYVFYDGMAGWIYKDYAKHNGIEKYEGTTYDEINNYLDNYIKNNKDKLNSIVYTFESKDGNNYFFTGLVNKR